MRKLLAFLTYTVGLALVRIAGPKPASSWFRRASRLDSRNDRALHYSAWSLWESGELEEAAAQYHQLLARLPQFSGAWLELARVLQGLGRHEKALDAVERALPREPHNAVLHYTRGESLVALGRMAQAIDAYRQAIQLDPAYADALGNLGAALGSLRRWHEAVRWNAEAMKLKPSVVHAHNLGVALAELGRFQEAEEAFKLAVSLEPSSAELQARLALAIAAQGRVADGLHTLEGALAIDPSNIAVRTSLSSLLVGEGRAQEAIEVALETVRLHVDNWQAHAALGWAYFQADLPQAGLAAFEIGVRLQPDVPETLAGYAACLSRLGRHDEAIEAFRRVLVADPDYLHRDEVAAQYFDTSKRSMVGPPDPGHSTT